MKLKVLTLALGLGVFAFSSCDKKVDTNMALNTTVDSVSYSIGASFGGNLLQNSLNEVNQDALLAGLNAALAQEDLRIEPRAGGAIINKFIKELKDKAAQANIAIGEKFLEENKGKEGVVTTESGLQYKILTAGTGAIPTKDQEVSVHYRGTTIDGKEFDSSYKRNEPAKFLPTRVIKGWTEALQLMPVGSKWELYIPSALAYGPRGAGANIGPNSTLIFEVELLEIVAAAAPATK
ncbi:FKBP-type peptidyl-prolyl cis-trans isomerase [Ancylomarina euxinus]|uniref:Peptidyl-prolyl cis-trans isomerase n=1 Tax=Ancylomarina euxinus TaxID=2283627 RepID=A0A425Y689_9BACT|nr:FKBP-type peptidyl-prolyl cis-trans isomerase [Ancylomarina euxinus]MCZ4694200.1 FKBP-type peptidyl-prolyl cis-trans isomerase [Ancylomarina euxinus]MUP14469.1 FKBP-type peptidyl-prolyl cis-trans isomerase [Ancylomarina euxinus]RRG23771.1 FKBP-type peptidyl-prolyl cis-trans isomerase [Ancylomarina euxinus]